MKASGEILPGRQAQWMTALLDAANAIALKLNPDSQEHQIEGHAVCGRQEAHNAWRAYGEFNSMSQSKHEAV
jgi:hypothetical protein